jgi:hypothetical protein
VEWVDRRRLEAFFVTGLVVGRRGSFLIEGMGVAYVHKISNLTETCVNDARVPVYCRSGERIFEAIFG